MPLDVRIASLPDMAISELKEPLSVPLLSNQVIMQNGEVLIQEGMPKLSLFSTHSKNFNNDNRYLVAGTICNEIKNSTLLNRINVLHEGLIFERLDNDIIRREILVKCLFSRSREIRRYNTSI